MINVDDSFTVLGTNVTFEANIKSKSGISIIGTLQGDVDATEISASAGSHVQGDIKALIAELHGSVTGNIHAGLVRVFPTAVIDGDIHCASLSVLPVSVLNGKIIIKGDPKEPAFA